MKKLLCSKLGIRLAILASAVVLVIAFGVSQRSSAYIEVEFTLGKVVSDSTTITVFSVEAVDKTKNTIIYRKVRDLKGTFPDVMKHNIGQAGFHPREWQTVIGWAEPGKTAIFFTNGGSGEMCIENYWYQMNAGGEWWNMTHAEPYLMRSYYGKPEKLVNFVNSILAGQEVVVPCMVTGNKEAVQLRTARVQRLRASLKLQDYNAQRDFVDWGSGGDELRPLAGMPGFSQTLALGKIGPGASAVPLGEINGDNKPDFALCASSQLLIFQNAGNAFNDVRTPSACGARAAGFADYDGDGKADLLAANPTGVKLFHNISSEKSTQYEDLSAGLPKQNYSHITAAAWLDYDGDGKPDIIAADGFRGLRLYRNLGTQPKEPAKLKFGKWYLCGPFDNTGQQGFDRVYPPEQGVDLAKQYKGKLNETVGWKESAFNDGQSNNLAIFPKPEFNNDAAAYVYREIEAPQDMLLDVGVGSDDTLTVWCNGEKVHSENVYRACAADQAILKLKLRGGKNTVLMKICQGNGGFEFYFGAKETPKLIPPLFEDISDSAGLGATGIAKNLKGDCIVVEDVNGDKRPDFVFCAGRGVLAINTQKGFVEASGSGIAFQAGGVTPVFGDFDGDGKRDLFIPQRGACKLLHNEGGGQFVDVTAQSGDLAKLNIDARSGAFAEFKKGRADLIVGCWKGPNRYLRNNGNGVFLDKTDEIGLTYNVFNTSGVAAPDLNKDEVPDLVFNNEGQDSVILISNPAWFNEPVAQMILPAGAPPPVATMTIPSDASAFFGLLGVCAVLLILFVIAKNGRGGQVALIALILLANFAAHSADWPTARGNSRRTGNVDNIQGPKSPNVLWIHKSQEHYIASPVPGSKALYVPAIGALNTGAFHAFSLDPKAEERELWGKSAPYITRPIVCSPVYVEGMVIFGDGMHQTDDAALYCIQADTGMPIWKYPVPGKLVHLEAGPTYHNGRVYACGGDAGIICVDTKRVIVDGKEQDLASVLPTLTKKWAEMVAKYEEEKKKDPALAIPPNEDAMPKVAPKLVWQKGVEKWHIDAPPTISGDFLLVASSYLEEEKEGKRALVCLRASDGSTVWETPLDINPWGGPTVAGNVVLVGCSNIRFDRKLIPQAKGEVISFDLANGQPKWKKQIAGGVLSPIAVKDETCIYAATDGSILARNINTGQRMWTNPYQAKNPFFASVAIAGEGVYAVDLGGTVHAMNFADGAGLWDYDLSGDPIVQSKASVFGSPIVHGGDLYLASCNPDGATPEPSYVVCLSDKKSAISIPSIPVAVDTAARSVSIPCRVAPRKLPSLKDIYPLEVIATFPSPRGQKAHETVVTINSKPSEIHAALEQIGLKAGKPAMGEGAEPTGAEITLALEIPGILSAPRRIPIEKFIVDARSGKTLAPAKWHFTGSSKRQPDPTKPDRVYGADLSGTLISIYLVTDETVCQANMTTAEQKMLRLETNKALLPPEGTELRLIISAAPPSNAHAKAGRLDSGFNGDPVTDQVRRELLSLTPEFHQKPAPLSKLAIPDPQELPNTLRVTTPLPDKEPPAVSKDFPPPPPPAKK